MKNYEIVNIISDIKPESYTQWKKLKKCMLMFLKDEVDHTDEYVSKLREADVLDRPCVEVYEEYTQWCEMNYITDIVGNRDFNKYINYYFGLNNKVSKCDGKSVRCYCK